ncbi:MAG: hypothetical protein KDD64_16820, partial [Bdellovibrionales bacterium]|nr:hypothetical protein [Bdellovibrionales bacterium]
VVVVVILCATQGAMAQDQNKSASALRGSEPMDGYSIPPLHPDRWEAWEILIAGGRNPFCGRVTIPLFADPACISRCNRTCGQGVEECNRERWGDEHSCAELSFACLNSCPTEDTECQDDCINFFRQCDNIAQNKFTDCVSTARDNDQSCYDGCRVVR